MSTDSFFTLKIFGVSEEAEDLLIAELFEAGSLGVYEDLPLPDQSSLYGESWNQQIIEVFPKILKAHFQRIPITLIEEFKLRYPELTFELTEEENRDWNAEWKKSFTSFEFIPGIWVQPSWDPSRLNGKVIKIDPGMAFGTGTHATTQLAGILIQELFNPNAQKSFLEIGAGTGILAFLAKHLGARSVIATENDPEAVRVLKENCAINNLQFEQIILVDHPMQKLTGKKFDFVVANIIQSVLEKLLLDFRELCASGGTLVVSGVLESDLASFIAVFEPHFLVCKQLVKDEWVALALTRK